MTTTILLFPRHNGLTNPAQRAYSTATSHQLNPSLILSVPKRSFRIGRSNTGLGLFATDEIKKGAFIVAYTGRRISNAEADRRERREIRQEAQQVQA